MTKSIEENMFLILEQLVEISRHYPSEYPIVGRERLDVTGKELTDAIKILDRDHLVDVVDRSPSGHFKVILRTEGKFEFERMQREKASSKNQGKEDIMNIMKATFTSKEIWEEIEKEYDTNKIAFSKKIDFVKPKPKRDIIFRDVEHAYIFAFANIGFPKPAVILAGGVIEELLRSYLKHKGIKSPKNTFESYIETCEKNGLLKSAINSLSSSARHFRNFVHLEKEKTKRDTISKATAKGAVSSIFTIANDFH